MSGIRSGEPGASGDGPPHRLVRIQPALGRLQDALPQ
jgi:hypothetical protein